MQKIGIDVLLDILNCKYPGMKPLYCSPQIANLSLLPSGGSRSIKQYKLVCIQYIEARSNRRWQFCNSFAVDLVNVTTARDI
jgi:hypothetical protein